jgi:hypothetical protein
MQRHADDASFDLSPGIISSLNGTAPSPEGELVRMAGLARENRHVSCQTASRRVTKFREHAGATHYRRPRARIEYIAAAVPSYRSLSQALINRTDEVIHLDAYVGTWRLDLSRQ